MESVFGHTEESTEDASGRKKSKIKSLKTRLFGKTKETNAERNPKLSQSASDVTLGKVLGSDEDLVCPHAAMGSRALSHDSIFLGDQVMSDTEPSRVLSQENVPSKVKTLQMKLQLQKLHFGPPPLVVPVKRQEELQSHSEDNLLNISDEASEEENLKVTSQPASCALSPTPKSAPTKPLPPTPMHSLSLPAQPESSASTVEAPLDFSTPAQFTASLDISAARHRMSVKPRNQRASTKKKNSSLPESPLPTLSSITYPESINDQVVVEKDTVKTVNEEFEKSPHVPSQSVEMSPVSSGEPPKLSSQSFSLKNQTLPGTGAPIVLRSKSQKHAPARPHSSFIESEIKHKKETLLEKQEIPFPKRNSLKKTGMAELFSEPLRSSAELQLRGEEQATKGPRSGSFVGVTEEIEAKQKIFGGKEEKSTKEKEESKSSQVKGNSCFVPQKSPVVPWDRKDSFRKTETVTASKNAPTEANVSKTDGLESSQELADDAEEGKTTFGIKLRATSHSLKLRSETGSERDSKASLNEDQSDKQKKQEMGETAGRMFEKVSTNTNSAPKPTDPVTRGTNSPAKQNAPLSNPLPNEAHKSKETETPESSESTASKSSSEVSWMSLAMEKTRSLQQLFSNRFPRDFTSAPTPAPQTQEQNANQTETVKPSVLAMQQKTGEAPVSFIKPRETSGDQNTNQSPSHPAVPTVTWTTQSPLRSVSQTPPILQSSDQKQTSWINQGFQTPAQLKSTTSASLDPIESLDSSSAKGAGEAPVQKDGALFSSVRVSRTGSVVDRAAFLEKRTEWETSSSTKEVELRKSQREFQISDEHLSSPKSILTNKYLLADARQGSKSAESSPTKILDKPPEVKWLRKNVGSSTSPSSSPNMSDSGQPSWMEMAKRKSMAWSDKSMD